MNRFPKQITGGDIAIAVAVGVALAVVLFILVFKALASNDKDRPRPITISGLVFKQVMITEPSALIGYNAQREMLSNLCDKHNGELTTERGGGGATTPTGFEVYVVTMTVTCMRK